MSSMKLKWNSWVYLGEDDFEDGILTMLSSTRAWTSVILTGKRDSRRHSITSFSKDDAMAETNFQMLEEVYHFALGRGLNILQ